MRYIFVTGSVISGLGKGVTTSSIGALLSARGVRITAIKIDPYLNVTAGTMSPFEHGEVYVLDDGGECDLDLGSYERFFGNVQLTADHNLTTGKIYSQVIAAERRGQYLGKTVQVDPHLTAAIQNWIERVAQIPVISSTSSTPFTSSTPCVSSGKPKASAGDDDDKTPPSSPESTNVLANVMYEKKKDCEKDGVAEVCLVEVGGTVGDVEQQVYLEALRQLRIHVGQDKVCHVHVSLVPTVVEHKTKPTQRGVRELLSYGFVPDLLICRTMDSPLKGETIRKIASSSGMDPKHVVSVCDTRNIYAVPIVLNQALVDEIILSKLQLTKYLTVVPNLKQWLNIANYHTLPNNDDQRSVVIGIVGKYTALKDAYLSLSHAIQHAAYYVQSNNNIKSVVVRWIEADDVLGKGAAETLTGVDGLIVPGGFGSRGVDGMIAVVKYARLKKVPFFGICLGMQVACIEWAQNVLQLPKANSTEFDPNTSHPVIYAPSSSQSKSKSDLKEELGNNPMCLGKRLTYLEDKTLAQKIYGGKQEIGERHRHRYQLNLMEFQKRMSTSGLNVSGHDKIDGSAHIVEISDQVVHPFFFAVQFHPEFLSRPFAPSPPFVQFIQAANIQHHHNSDVVLMIGKLFAM